MNLTPPSNKRMQPRDIRAMAGIERAAAIVGGQVVLAERLGVSARHLRMKAACERPITRGDVRETAAALRDRADEASQLAARMEALADEMEG